MTPLEQFRQAGLTEKQMECLSMYVFDGLRQPEIAERLGVSQPAVSQLISKAQEKLAKVGLRAKKLELDEPVRTIPTDPHVLDQLGPSDVRAEW